MVPDRRHERQPVVDPADEPVCRAGTGVGHGASLTDGYRRVAGEFVKGLRRLIDFPGQPQIQRCRPLANSPGGVVDGAVARAKPAAVGTAIVAGSLPERDAAEVGTYADDYQPLRLFDSGRIRLRITQV